MKTILIVGILLIGISGQAMSMGHPHNMFAARKQMRTRTSASVTKTKSASSLSCQHTVQLVKIALNDRLLAVLAHIRPAQAN